MPAEASGALAIMLLLAAWIGVVELLARRTTIQPEWSRKLVHLGAGLGCLLFPLLLDRATTVLLLAVVSGAGLWLAEHTGWLQCLCRVKRRSWGSVYYPFAIAILFWLTDGKYGIYMGAVLVLTVADAAAALVGSRFGRIRYRTGGVDEHKSLEGSVAFWWLAFLAVFLPLTWQGAAGRWQALLSAFLAATLLTLVEAVSIGGRDNLYVPLLAAFMLLKTVTKSVPELIMQSISILILSVVLPVANRHGKLLRIKTLIIMSIILYGIWSLGSVDWAVPLLAAILFFLVVCAGTSGAQRRALADRRMVLLATPAAVLMALANLTGLFRFVYGPFLASVLVPLLVGVVVQMDCGGIGWHWSARQLAMALAAMASVLAVPLLMRRGADTASLLLLSCGVLATAWIGTGIMAGRPQGTGGAVALVAVVFAVALTAVGQVYQVLGLWRPLLWADVYGREADVLIPVGPWGELPKR